ncbi:PspC domain-containing protein [Phycicoccus sp. CSK15P-2]|uniref:PspC domain-containing protein n=1 Tax=Phycicoccus sp. CSK15P-2 TaxID=2807627 RepID=UPI00194DDAF4|nr:PspC domain-containing protein [Phycicoccus sp. CSK15P-2]MBM6402807.1 PspC domain-containing protein [Phycicoccus sp. CSK15P-2]
MTDTSHYGPAPSRGDSTLDDLFDRLRTSGWHRDTDRRWFGGVCAGIAARFDVDPLLIRAAAVVLTFAGGLGIPLYLVLWLLLPDRGGRMLAERALRHGDGPAVLLLVATSVFFVGGVVSYGLSGADWNGSLWVLLPVVLVVWFLATRASPSGTSTPRPDPAVTTPPPPPTEGPTMAAPTSSFAPAGVPAAPGPAPARPARYGEPGGWSPPRYGEPGGWNTPPPAPPTPPRSAELVPPPPPSPRRRRPSGYVGLMSLGLAVALFGAGIALSDPLGLDAVPAALGFALALTGVSVVVIALALSGRAAGFSGFLVAVLAVPTIATAAASNIPEDRIGDRVWTPTAASLPADYSLGAGDATLDLTALSGLPTLDSSDDPPTIDADLTAGQLVVRVPDGLDLRVESSIDFGEIRHEEVTEYVGDRTVFARNGTDVTEEVVIGDDTPDLVVRTHVDFGSIVIEEQS